MPKRDDPSYRLKDGELIGFDRRGFYVELLDRRVSNGVIRACHYSETIVNNSTRHLRVPGSPPDPLLSPRRRLGDRPDPEERRPARRPPARQPGPRRGPPLPPVPLHPLPKAPLPQVPKVQAPALPQVQLPTRPVARTLRPPPACEPGATPGGRCNLALSELWPAPSMIR